MFGEMGYTFREIRERLAAGWCGKTIGRAPRSTPIWPTGAPRENVFIGVAIVLSPHRAGLHSRSEALRPIV